MPFLMEPIATEFSYASWERSVLASSQFVGMWIGGIVGGVIADASGRAARMMLSLVGLTVGGVAPTILPNLASSARVLVGLSLTISYQAGNSWLAESIPTSSRSLALSALHISIAVGGLLSVGLAVLIDAWRPLLLVNTAPTVIVGLLLGRFVLRHESARWLLVSGRHDRALEVLRRIARRSGAAPPHALHEEGGGGGGAKADEASTLPLARAAAARGGGGGASSATNRCGASTSSAASCASRSTLAPRAPSSGWARTSRRLGSTRSRAASTLRRRAARSWATS